jgi:hypothetical protein
MICQSSRRKLLYPVSKYRHAIEPELLLLSVYFVFVLGSEIRALARRKP